MNFLKNSKKPKKSKDSPYKIEFLSGAGQWSVAICVLVLIFALIF